MKVSILKGHEQVQQKQVKDRTFYEQLAYAHLGGAFPVEFRLTVRDAHSGYPVGDYELDPGSFRVNQFNSLEINRFELKLQPLASELKAVGAK